MSLVWTVAAVAIIVILLKIVIFLVAMVIWQAKLLRKSKKKELYIEVEAMRRKLETEREISKAYLRDLTEMTSELKKFRIGRLKFLKSNRVNPKPREKFGLIPGKNVTLSVIKLIVEPFN
ncbi:unnamed protein product [Microthlaspi erraticum]|uniref:Uncharacterized protein n=1 Tax=Microthlaspi erraticum TaxID=1685480 RepID=A0A6D2IIZ6_9BRAS|nr:unnamed protein product [Microthlaspi erraticum]